MVRQRCRRVAQFALIAVLGLGCLPLAANSPPAAEESRCHLVVLASIDDPYYPLAEEIAAVEGAPLAPTLPEALACAPEFLIWVASPGFLSDAAMVSYGQAIKAHATAVSSGIITGSSLARARDLWERRTEVSAEIVAAVNAPNPSAHIDVGRITTVSQSQTTQRPLTSQNFLETLQTADYVTFTGHGGNSYLRIDDDIMIKSAAIPPLDAVVVSTGSCQTFRPWNRDSIARTFVDRGAAAYSGFVHSPNEGYLIGHFDALPYRYTWPEFPIGHVLQVQNRGTQQGFARIPFQFLLGDPRIALQPRAPYRLATERVAGNRRVLAFEEVPAGAVPIRIDGGAAYNFVSVPGLTAAAGSDPFYNSKLQMVAMGDDRLVLLIHPGGALTLEMRRHAPWYWYPVDVLLDSLDHTLVYSQQTGGDVMVGVVGILALFWAAWKALKRRLTWPEVRLALVVGAAAAILQAGYSLLRLDRVTITSKAVAFSPLSIPAAGLVAGCGVLMAWRARRWSGRVAALLVATVASWTPMAFGLLVFGAWNVLGARPKLGTAIYAHTFGLLPLPTFAVCAALFVLVARFARRAAPAAPPSGLQTRLGSSGATPE